MRNSFDQLESRRLLSSILYVDVNSPAVTPDGVSWATAFPDLQQALAVAAFGDVLRIADGTYLPTNGPDRSATFALKDDVDLIGGYAGAGAADPDQRDIALFQTILSGDIGTPGVRADNSFHIVSATAANFVSDATTIDGLTIRDAYSNDPNDGQQGGGGINIEFGGSPHVVNCTFVANHMNGFGAAAVITGSASWLTNPTFTNCTFDENHAIPDSGFISDGGAVYAYFASPTFVDCRFSNGSATRGGAATINRGANVSFLRCSFVRNTAATGGAVFVEGGTATFDGCQFNGNTATVLRGGAIRGGLSQSYDLTVTNSTFVGNQSVENGGAVYLTSGGTRQVINSTFVDNSATSNGGAIYAVGGSIANTVAWFNAAPIDPQIRSGAAVTYSNVQDGFDGIGNIDSDPQFVRNPSPGADNTWGTVDDDYGDLRVQITSRNVDAGNNAAVPAGVTTDITGKPRFFDFPGVNDGAGAVVDMGAHELTTRLGLLRVPEGGTLALPAGGHTFFVEQLDLGANATLDVRDDSLIIDYRGASSLMDLANQIRTARAGGTWTGAGMTSSTARDTPLRNTTLGIMEAGDFKSIYGPAPFGGHAIDASAVLIKYTYYGDADFNGTVNFDDYARIDNGFSTNKSGWLNGDFDGNGVINFDDYSLIDLAFNTQSGLPRGKLRV